MMIRDLPSFFHVAHDGEELIGLLGSQNGGGLIQNEDVGAAEQDLHDFHGLLLGNRHIVDLHVGVDLEAVLLADVLDLLAGTVQVQLALQAQDDILRGGENIDQLEVLVDHTDAKVESILGRGDGDGLVVDIDLSLIGEVDAGEHIHQGGLAAAVFAQQRQDLTLVQLKVHIFVCDDLAAEALGDVLHSNCAFFFQGCSSFLSAQLAATPRKTPGVDSIRFILPYM